MASSFSLNVTANDADIRIGDTVEYTITAINTGDEILYEPAFIFCIDGQDDWNYVSDDASLYHYDGTIEYLYGHFHIVPIANPPEHPRYYTLGVGETMTIKCSFTALRAGSYSHWVFMAFQNDHVQHYTELDTTVSKVLEVGDDPTPPPNFDDIVGVTVTKTTEDSPTEVLQDVVFTITVENTGSVTIENVTVTDVLPAEMSYVSDDSDGSEVLDDDSEGTGVIVWNLTALGAGATKVIELTAQFDDGTRDATYINNVSVSGKGGDGFAITSAFAMGAVVLDTHELEITSTHEVTTP